MGGGGNTPPPPPTSRVPRGYWNTAASICKITVYLNHSILMKVQRENNENEIFWKVNVIYEILRAVAF